jgi:hypothetical protein
VEEDFKNIVAMLINNNANIEARKKSGLTPLDIGEYCYDLLLNSVISNQYF